MKRCLFNIDYWKQYIKEQFIEQFELLYESIQNRLIPAFNTIEKEAEEVSKKEWDRLCSSCYSPDIDPADLAEKAQEAGIKYYMTISDIKQALLNITTTSFYHLFEQQIIFFLRREILHPSQENDINRMKICIFKHKLRKRGIDICTFHSWNKIDELRLVSNTIKHAEGPSASKLRTLRPDLFIPINSEAKKTFFGDAIPDVYMPLAGEEIFITIDDLLEYKNALIDFWIEFINTCQASGVVGEEKKSVV